MAHGCVFELYGLIRVKTCSPCHAVNSAGGCSRNAQEYAGEGGSAVPLHARQQRRHGDPAVVRQGLPAGEDEKEREFFTTEC